MAVDNDDEEGSILEASCTRGFHTHWELSPAGVSSPET